MGFISWVWRKILLFITIHPKNVSARASIWFKSAAGKTQPDTRTGAGTSVQGAVNMSSSTTKWMLAWVWARAARYIDTILYIYSSARTSSAPAPLWQQSQEKRIFTIDIAQRSNVLEWEATKKKKCKREHFHSRLLAGSSLFINKR